MKLIHKKLFLTALAAILITGCTTTPSSSLTSSEAENSAISEQSQSNETSTSETSIVSENSSLISEQVSEVLDYPLVTFNVKVPIAIASDAKVKIAGSFNGWNPLDEHYVLTRVDNYNFTIDVNFAVKDIATTIEYKYVLLLAGQDDNGWTNVEGGPSGEEIGNRTYKLVIGSQIKNDVVAAFKNNIGKTSLTRGTLTTTTLTMNQYADKRTRKIRIWTPDGYNPSGTKTYPVIYMHDGQNLFDTYTAFAGEWKIDEAIGQLMDGGYDGAIVVGIDNSSERLNELTVGWPLSSSGSSNNIRPDGEKYAAFIVETVKPYIDTNYKTKSNAQNTFIGGSSLGGVMSFYMTLTYPLVFGNALLFSTSMWVYNEGTISNVINAANLGALSTKPKIYVYGGGSEGSNIDKHVNDIYNAFIANGYNDTMIKAHVEPGKGHNEAAWSLHFPIAMRWLANI